MPQLLLELFSEEIPASMQFGAIKQLEESFAAKAKDSGVSYDEIRSFVTPRRLTLIVDGLPKVQADVSEERRGPREDAPDKAIEGFLRSTGFASKDELQLRETPKGTFFFAVIEKKGEATADILRHLIEEILVGFSWPKSMKWGRNTIRWVRPLHHILCLFDQKVVPVQFGHIKAGNQTCGHRFMGPDLFKVKNADEYLQKLEKAKVMLDHNERRAKIEQDMNKLAKAAGHLVKKDEKLLDEVTGLVEYPEVLTGQIDARFMELPSEVLMTSMRSHQKYFSTTDSQGKLAPHFITVSNITCDDKGARIIHGNQRVLKARLDDAKFFWDQDRRVSLESRAQTLDSMIFHAKLGNMLDKTKRITALAKLFAVWIPHANLMLVERAAGLCKADLATEMVGEFPELQGLMGSYYAAESKEDAQVVDAIKAHYQPLGPNDECPTQPISIAVALADKIDTLVGLFAVGEKPTGSKDPFALRRAALGIIRIIMDNNLRVPLRLMFEKSISLYPKTLFKAKGDIKKAISNIALKKQPSPQQLVINDLLGFFIDRLRVVLKDNNIRHDLIEAVFNDGSEDDFVRLVGRVNALEVFVESKDGQDLCAAYKRANNILSAEEKKDGKAYEGNPSKDLLQTEEEQSLFASFKRLKPLINKHIKAEDYKEVMCELASLREPIDTFFEKVQVNAPDKALRKNRLLLLSQFRSSLGKVANFDKVENA